MYMIEDIKKALKSVSRLYEDVEISEDYKNYKIVKDALEKQIPKKPILGYGRIDWDGMYTDSWACPACNEEVPAPYCEYDCCTWCGQKIDWDDVDGAKFG